MKEFNAVNLANALRVARPTLGTEGIPLYRIVRLVAFEDILGRGSGGLAYHAGKKLGSALGLNDLDAFLALCNELKIGIIKVPVVSDSLIRVEVFECVTCSGLQSVGRTLCHFEGGMIAGAVEGILKKSARAVETTCIGGLGHDSCGFDVRLGGELPRLQS